MVDYEVEVTPEVERLAARPYQVNIAYDPESGDYVARVPELQGLVTGGKTLEEAQAMAEDAIQTWIASALYWGDPVPEPQGVAAHAPAAS